VADGRAALRGLAAVLIALLGPGLVAALMWNLNQQKPTGLGAMAGDAENHRGNCEEETTRLD
jgi:hypothetical protein